MLRQFAAGAALAVAALVGALPAAAASTPTATTGPVSSVGPTTATVSGSVNPNGAATTWYVEYGTSTSYGSKTSSSNAGSGTSSVSVSPALSGLTPGTAYHYRLVATNSSGTGRGADGLLTTSSAPAVVTGNAANVTPDSAVLTGTVNPSSRATTWYFEYGTSTSYGTKTSVKDAGSGTSPVAVSAQLTGLTSGRTYHFRLVATSDAGTSRGSDQTFLPTAPPTVTTKAASSVKDSTANLNATVDPNGKSTTAYFDYGTTTGYGSKSSTKNVGSGSSAANVSIGVTGLAAGTVYHFRVVATNSIGTNASADMTFTTTGRPVVKSMTASAIGANSATLNGTVDRNGHSTNWYFQSGPTAAYGLFTPTRSASSSSGAHAVSEAIGNLSPGRSYHFRIVATNGLGTSYGSDSVFTTAGPAVSLATSSGTVILNGAVRLSGKVASGRENETVIVYSQRFGGGSFRSIATVLTDPGGTWTLRVRPTIRTTYKGVWNGATSTLVTIGVRPVVSLRTLPGQRLKTRVVAGRSFAGKTVQLQRRTLGGAWLTIARARLGGSSGATFHPRLPHGRSTVRVAISVNQVGSGFLAGFSPAITVRR